MQDVDENIIYDSSTLRLRNIALTYNMPSKFLDKTPFGKLSLSVAGNNLWFKAFNIPDGLNFDPEVISAQAGLNARGLDFNTDPSYRQISFSIKASF